MNIHKSCDSLSIWSFYKIIETENLAYLIKGYNLDNEITLKNKDKEVLINCWNDIVTEYGMLTVNSDIIKNYKLQLLISALEFEHSVSINILNKFSELESTDILLLLNEFGYDIDIEKDLAPQLTSVVSKLKSLKNRIKIHKINYSKKYQKNVKKVEVNLDREALMLEMNLKISHGINVRKTTVERWLNMVELNNEKASING